MNASRRRASFAFMYLSSWKSFTSPAICEAKGDASKRLMRVMPGLAATMFPQACSSELPTGLTMPSPVTTTRRRLKSRAPSIAANASRLLAVRHDEIDGLLHRGDFLGFLVRNFRFEFFLQRHHQFHGVERVRAKIIDK